MEKTKILSVLISGTIYLECNQLLSLVIEDTRDTKKLINNMTLLK